MNLNLLYSTQHFYKYSLMVVESLGIDMKRCEIYSQKTLLFYYFSTAEIENLFLLEIVNKKNNGKLNSILQTELKNVLISAVEK
jgi:hypothetical protein